MANADAAITIDTARIAATVKALNSEFGPKFGRGLQAGLRKAAGPALNRAKGYLPQDSDMPSGFAYKNNQTWPKANAANSRRDGRPWPRYDRQAAIAGLRVRSRRGKARMVNNRWVGGQTASIALESRDPAAAIFETAGKGRGTKSEKAQRLIRGFEAATTVGPNRYRVVLPAVIDTRPEIVAEINRLVDDAEQRIRAARTTDQWSVRR